MLYQGEALAIDLGFMTLQAKRYGHPSGIPTLAIHGWLDNAGSFDFLAPLLIDHYVVALDLPGHGLSDHLPEGMQYHLTEAVGFIYQVIQYLGWSDAVIIGHSLGGGSGDIISLLDTSGG